jgi:hypothetical protein
MMRVAPVLLAVGQELWQADEVPRLTASALYRFEPEPDPEVAWSDLQRFSSGDELGRPAGRSLNARELARMEKAFKAAGLPEQPERLRLSRWREYLEAGNEGAAQRGWWVGFVRPRDPNLADREAWVYAAKEHRKLLKQAISQGLIKARIAASNLSACSGPVPLEKLVLNRAELEKFAAILEMHVAEASTSAMHNKYLGGQPAESNDPAGQIEPVQPGMLVAIEKDPELFAARGGTPGPVKPHEESCSGVGQSKRLTWRMLAWPYMVKKLAAEGYPTAKALDSALHESTGDEDSPFRAGTGANRGVLVLRMTGRTLAQKTIQNNWRALRREANLM